MSRNVIRATFEDDDSKDYRVVRTIKIKPEWKELHDECDKLADEARLAFAKLKSLRNKMWSTIEEDTDCYENMRYNSERGEIDILEDN